MLHFKGISNQLISYFSAAMTVPNVGNLFQGRGARVIFSMQFFLTSTLSSNSSKLLPEPDLVSFKQKNGIICLQSHAGRDSSSAQETNGELSAFAALHYKYRGASCSLLKLG